MTIQLRTDADTLVTRSVPVADLPGTPRRGGFAAGTPILTADGPRPVESLVPGDRIVTRERGLVPLVARDIAVGRACTIAGGDPEDDPAILAASQHIALRAAGSVTIRPAGHLAVGALQDMPLHRLDLGAPLTIYAAGLEAPTGHAARDAITLPH